MASDTEGHSGGTRDLEAERFARFLRENGLKLTQERRAILDAFLLLDEAVEAEVLLDRLRQSGARVSRATIYRTLDLLVQTGLARKVRLGTDHYYFERIMGRRQHEHMICLGCGKVIEWFDKELEGLVSANVEHHRFEAARYSVQVFGYCCACAASSSRRSRSQRM